MYLYLTASHSSFLLFFLLYHHPAPVSQEQAVHLLADIDVEVLHAHVQLLHLEFGTVGLVTSLLSAVPVFDGSKSVVEWGCLRYAQTRPRCCLAP